MTAVNLYLKIHCLGILKSITNSEVVEIAWPQNNQLETALLTLVTAYPNVANELPRCACAIGDEIVPRSYQLQAGDELVLLPPVGGG